MYVIYASFINRRPLGLLLLTRVLFLLKAFASLWGIWISAMKRPVEDVVDRKRRRLDLAQVAAELRAAHLHQPALAFVQEARKRSHKPA